LSASERILSAAAMAVIRADSGLSSDHISLSRSHLTFHDRHY
jgi:hypothetical protein